MKNRDNIRKSLNKSETKSKKLKTRAKLKFPFTDTSIELKVKEMLDKLNIKYEHPYIFKDSLSCDFAIPTLKLIIECDGCYWHSCPKHHPKARITNDKERDKYTTYFGWKTLRLWEHEINDDPEKCLNKIKQCLSRP